MKIVLFQPEIPQNTGNIARTCAATNTGLVLVRPLGFSLQDRHMKRAGLDYWKDVELEVVDELVVTKECCFFSSKATRLYTDVKYTKQSVLVFGSETAGLPVSFREQFPEQFYRIPMVEGQRCLNLSSSAAIVLYEALRQTNFDFSS